jgi:hypothetical protein
MQLELNSDERQFLSKVLDHRLVELIREIDHADSREFREGLKVEADLLNSLKNKLETGSA